MLLENIINHKYFKGILLSVFIILTLIFYFRRFFTTGIYFDDQFLKKQVISSDTHYTGKSMHGDMNIIIRQLKNNQNGVDVIFQLPNNINKQYTVNLAGEDYWGTEIKNIKDENGNVIFEGTYQKNSYFLVDKNGEVVMDHSIRILVNGETPYNAEYQIPLRKIAELASFSGETIRGKYPYLLFAIFLFIVTWIDIKYPLFFFRMKYVLSVEDPEPSEFYTTMQKIGWYIYTIAGGVLLIIAVI